MLKQVKIGRLINLLWVNTALSVSTFFYDTCFFISDVSFALLDAFVLRGNEIHGEEASTEYGGGKEERHARVKTSLAPESEGVLYGAKWIQRQK